MIKFIILLALFNIQPVHADLGLDRDSNGRYLLSHESCEELTTVTKALDQWTKNSHEIKTCPVNTQSPSERNNRCEYDITNCVPDHVIKYIGVQPKNAGPNCWNLALVMKNILPALRYSHSDEMAFYMSSPLCRQLKNNEDKIPGDIGAIRKVLTNATEEFHGFIYISDALSYSKNGVAKENPYMLLPTDVVFGIYGVPDDKRCRQNEIDMKLRCGNAVSYFRCMSMEEYLSKQNTPKQIITAISDINRFDKCLEGKTIKDNPLSKEAGKNLMDSLNVISNYLYDETEKEKASELKNAENIFMLASINLRLNSIAMQLGVEGYEGYGYVLGGFSEHIRALTEELKGKK